MELVQGEAGSCFQFGREKAGHDQLHRGKDDLEPPFLNFKRIQDLVVMVLFLTRSPNQRYIDSCSIDKSDRVGYFGKGNDPPAPRQSTWTTIHIVRESLRQGLSHTLPTGLGNPKSWVFYPPIVGRRTKQFQAADNRCRNLPVREWDWLRGS